MCVNSEPSSTAREIRPPNVRDLIASTTIDTGFTFAHACSQPGIDCSVTKAVLANTNGNTHTKLDACAASTFPAVIALTAPLQEDARPDSHAASSATSS